MTDEQSFQAALRADPTDATTRLVYADWLDDRDRRLDAALQRVLAAPGDDARRLEYAAVVEAKDLARAEFIRVQVELAKSGPCPATIYRPQFDAPDYGGKMYVVPPPMKEKKPCGWCPVCKLKISERDNPYSKMEALSKTVLADANRITFRRGFVEVLTCTAADWMRHGAELRERMPLSRVTLTTFPEVHTQSSLMIPRTYRFWLDGRMKFVEKTEREIALNRSPDEPLRGAIEALLPLEFPGIEFDLSELRAGEVVFDSQGNAVGVSMGDGTTVSHGTFFGDGTPVTWDHP